MPQNPVAFVFPGAAVALCGAEATFYARHEDIMQPFLEMASGVAGTDFVDSLNAGRLGQLDERNNQLFTYAYSHAVAQAHMDAGVSPALVAGYSLGIYAAVSVSGAVEFEQCLSIVGTAFDIMKAQCAGGVYGMGAIIGLSEAETRRILASGDYPSVCRTNTNNETCGVFSGLKDDMGRFFKDARDHGALSTVTFRVSVPYHHPRYIAPASKKFFDALQTFAWRDAQIPILSSLNQAPLVKAADLVKFLAQNLASPVQWQKVAEAIARRGVTIAYECGPGISLCQNNRFIPNHIRYVTIRKSVRRDPV
jgi:[acyl-carrier-protein] S-malonyltransferase